MSRLEESLRRSFPAHMDAVHEGEYEIRPYNDAWMAWGVLEQYKNTVRDAFSSSRLGARTARQVLSCEQERCSPSRPPARTRRERFKRLDVTPDGLGGFAINQVLHGLRAVQLE
jgi:hypothetical protein